MKQKTIIYVISKKRKPLMPTTRCGHVRKLLKESKAVVISTNPFTIRLKYDTPDIVQSLYYGNDTGRENIGVGVSDENGNCVYLSELTTNNKLVKKNMTSRTQARRSRRRHNRQSKQRKSNHDKTAIKNGDNDTVCTKHSCKSVKIKYPGADEPVTHKVIRGKEAKFNNRKRSEGWITPSARQLIQMHMNMLKQAIEIMPISHVSLERVCFDFQKLENEDIKAWQYGKGPLYGYSDYKEYINDVQHGTCLFCGKKKIEYYHHIIPRKAGGSDKVSNIAGLCYDCHYGPQGVHKCQETQDKLFDMKSESNKSYKVGLLNSVMPVLIEEMAKFCDKNGLIFSITDGKETAKTRSTIGVDKTHALDGYCISLSNRDINTPKFIPDRIFEQRRYKKKSKNNIQKLNRREYWLDGKLVAINRHKAIDQKEDSLEEFLTKYRETHTEKEIQQIMHQIDIRPAKRNYTYHKDGRVCKFHVGDLICYEKKTKNKENTKRDTFVCEGLRFTKDENEAKILHNKTKEKKMKFCYVLKSGCIPYVGFRVFTY
ncbi:MAG: RRXRR domain-containing protein [Acutalibacteraceae bacterium]|nr:RRXRR domain-containing protein [Acutalibacteraceae bacterium]